MLWRWILVPFYFVLVTALFAKEYEVPTSDIPGFFARLPKDATSVVFTKAAVYHCNEDIVLPDRQLLVIDGRGAKLVLGPNSCGFTRYVADQRAALRMTASRYAIRDFSAIEGGKKGVDLAASLGSTIINCRFLGQSQAAIDLRFCLQTRIQNVLVTNPKQKGIVLRQGDWPGATATNSQSNSSVLDQCRVYCAPSTTMAFSVLNSGGVRMSDCISEGAPADYDLFLSAVMDGNDESIASNPVVKSFKLENFHVEHKVRIASIYVNMPVKSSVVLSNVYWNGTQSAPVLQYVSGQVNLQDIGWFNRSFRIHSRVQNPSISIFRCHNYLNIDKEADRTPKRAGILQLVDPLPGHSVLSLNRIRVSQAVW